jgi:hypothetical protein
VYVHEVAAINADPMYIRDNLSPGQIKEVQANFADFAKAISIFGDDAKKVEQLFEAMPDVSFGKDPEMTAQTLGENKVNPFGVMGFSRATLNPIYHVRLMIAEYQADRYKEAQELKQVLELRVLSLEYANKKMPDVKLEKEIEYTQSRIDRLAEKIRKAEESVQ